MPSSLVIIPTYNEIENIEKIIKTVFELPVPFDVLIVDDGSPDGTGQKVAELQNQYPDRLFLEQRTGKLGLGSAYIHGFKWALNQPKGYEYICEMDADFSHNPADLPRLVAACTNQNADMSVGSRYKNGVNVINWDMKRLLLSYFASKYVRFITGITLTDTTAGFVCYHKTVLETIELDKIKFVGYAFQIEMKFKSWKSGFNIVDVPIVFTDRTLGSSKMSGGIIREAVFGVIQLKINSFFSRYPQKKSIAQV